jgi:hypothetical protein
MLIYRIKIHSNPVIKYADLILNKKKRMFQNSIVCYDGMLNIILEALYDSHKNPTIAFVENNLVREHMHTVQFTTDVYNSYIKTLIITAPLNITVPKINFNQIKTYCKNHHYNNITIYGELCKKCTPLN